MRRMPRSSPSDLEAVDALPARRTCVMLLMRQGAHRLPGAREHELQRTRQAYPVHARGCVPVIHGCELDTWERCSVADKAAQDPSCAWTISMRSTSTEEGSMVLVAARIGAFILLLAAYICMESNDWLCAWARTGPTSTCTMAIRAQGAGRFSI